MSILGPWNGEGSLPDALVVEVAGCERAGWAALRSLQGDPTVDVLRYTVTDPGDPARGVASTKALVAGLEGLNVLWSDLAEGEKESQGIDLSDAARKFEFFEDVAMYRTDLVVHQGTQWAVKSVYQDDHLGSTIVVCVVSEQSGS